MKKIIFLSMAVIAATLLYVPSVGATSIDCGSRTREVINNDPSGSLSWGSPVFIGMVGSQYKYQVSATQNYTWSTTSWVETSCDQVPQGYGNPQWVTTGVNDAIDKVVFTYTALTSSQGAPAIGSSAWGFFGEAIYSQSMVIVGQTYRYYAVSGATVPEPSTLLLSGSGLAGLVIFRRKFRVGGLKPMA